MRVSTIFTAFILPVLLSFLAYAAYRASTRSFPAYPFTLPPRPPLTYNSLLLNATRHPHPLLYAPETLAHHPTEPYFITGCYDGQIVRIDPTTSPLTITPLTYTGYAASLTPPLAPLCRSPGDPFLCGRPLGLAFRDAHTLLIADAYHGLLQYDLASGTLTSLHNLTDADTNSVAVRRDGSVVYFTSASAAYRNFEVTYSFVAGECSGGLLSYTFATGEVEWLMRGLCFANGVLLLDEDREVVVVESGRARVHALHLPTRKHRVVLPNLPCLPDNLSLDPVASSSPTTTTSSSSSSAYYWVGCGGVPRSEGRPSLYDDLAPHALVRRWLMTLVPYWLIMMLEEKSAMVGRVKVVGGEHEVVEWWMDPKADTVHSTTGVLYSEEQGGTLWLTSYKRDWEHLFSIPYQPPPQ